MGEIQFETNQHSRPSRNLSFFFSPCLVQLVFTLYRSFFSLPLPTSISLCRGFFFCFAKNFVHSSSCAFVQRAVAGSRIRSEFKSSDEKTQTCVFTDQTIIIR